MAKDRRTPVDPPPAEHEIFARESRSSNLVAYAAIKYFSYVIIVVAILYFLARWVLPLFVG